MDTGRGASDTGVCWGGGQGMDSDRLGKSGRITWGEMPDVGDGRMEAACVDGICVPMQQSCKICTCTPELKA